MIERLASVRPSAGVGVLRSRWGLFAGGLLASLGVANAANAQSASYFARDHNVSVTDRPRPDYAPMGLALGQFTAYPTLSVREQYDDNIYASGGGAAQSDFITTVSPGLSVSTNWARNSISAHASATSNLYASHSSENTTDYSIGTNGRLDVGQEDSISGSVGYDRFTEARTSENSISGTTSPIQFSIASASVTGVKTFNRLQLTGGVNYSNINFSNAEYAGGRVASLAYLNQNDTVVNGQAAYAITPEISIFGVASYNDRSDISPTPTVSPERTSHGYEVNLGTSFDLTALVRGNVQVGYLQQDYVSQTFHTVSGPSVHGSLEYFLSGLTTISLTTDRNVVDAVDPVAVSYLQTNGQLRIDHELLRNVILTGRASYETDAYTGLDRTDQRENFGFSASYLMNRLVSLSAGYSFLHINSFGVERINDYSVNVLTLGLQLHL